MCVAVYVRVSTLDQEKGIKSQMKAIEDYLRGHGIDDARWYQDRLSGATTKRPAFEKLQKDIFNGKIKTVVVWKLDRLSRSLRDGINILCEWLDKDVRVVAIAQQLDFNGSVGQLIASVLFAVAQMERDNLRENTKRGLYAAKARGVKLGKRPKLFATDIVPMVRAGLGVGAIATKLGKSRQAIYDALARDDINLSDLHASKK